MAASVISGHGSTYGGHRATAVLASQQLPTVLTSHTSNAGEQVRKVAVSRDVPGLIALGGETVVELVQLVVEADLAFDGETAYKLVLLHSFVIGARTTALDFSAKTGSAAEHRDGHTYIELCVASVDSRIRLLSCAVALPTPGQAQPQSAALDPTIENILRTGELGPASINSVCWCRARDYRNVFAFGCDDGRCATVSIKSSIEDSDYSLVGATEDKQLYDLYDLPHSHAVLGVSFHESLFRTLATYDASGSIRLLEWYDTSEKAGGRAYTMVDPKQLASTFASAYATRDEARTGLGRRGMAEWKSEDVNMFGAVMGTRWLIWDMRRAGGGKPAATGEAFFEGADCFRWCPTNDRLFAVASSSPEAQPAIKLINLAAPKAPRSYNITAGSRNTVNDLAWHPTQELLFVAVGHRLQVMSIE